MLRNAMEMEACRQELASLIALKGKVASMAKNLSVNATDVESVLNERMRLLSTHIETYRALSYAPKEQRQSLKVLTLVGDLPRALIEARLILGWTQRDLADYAAMKPQQLCRYEKNMYANISLTKAIAIAELLNDRIGQIGAFALSLPDSVCDRNA